MRSVFSFVIFFFLVSGVVVSAHASERICGVLNNNVVSVQLHSVRQLIEQDFEGTLVELKNAGFDAVEFAGRYGKFKKDPKGLKLYLDNLSLEVSGVHAGLSQLRGDVGNSNLQFFKDIGAKLVIVPHDPRVDTVDDINYLIDELNFLTAKVQKYGMTLGYHNHAKEFKVFGSSTFWDYLASNTNKMLALQLDVGWANYAGADSIEQFRRYAGRIASTHLKVRTHDGEDKSPIIGRDGYDWYQLVKNGLSIGGTRWFVIEQEEFPDNLSPIQALAASKAGIDKVITSLKEECE
ncbi:sugar phosphate isomerase/epimerase [Alteromonas sp. KUL106]|uniref:sugar phosphate isomerase/epimerase family protein n=1 Tax=Alteromonas sp. KUL106 TaxID=2480799 RepID=UPI0013598326|nr:sugar phosphate isomerase/epimerase [Alteromonas sp. KUL106]